MIRRLLLTLTVIAPMLALAPAALAEGPPPVTAADRVLGRAGAPVTVVEYASFVCSHCANWHLNVLPEFKTRFIDTGKVRLVFRDLPTEPAQVAASAAAVARCAAPERYFDVAGAFMHGQAALRDGGDMADWYSAAIGVSGKTRPEIEACLALPATRANLQASMEGAAAAGVTGTPSFFVNGKAVVDTSLAGLTAAITPLLPAH